MLDGMTIMWVAAIFATAIGVGSLAHFTYIAIRWPAADGQVTGNRTRHAQDDSGSSTVYAADITFHTAAGQRYTILSDVQRRRPWPIGTPLQVHYKPSNPNHAMTMTPWQRLLFSGFFIAVAGATWLRLFDVIR